jgi:hypothetical protein
MALAIAMIVIVRAIFIGGLLTALLNLLEKSHPARGTHSLRA